MLVLVTLDSFEGHMRAEKENVSIILNASQLNILPDAHARSQICLHKAGQIMYEVLHRRQQFTPVMVPFFFLSNLFEQLVCSESVQI